MPDPRRTNELHPPGHARGGAKADGGRAKGASVGGAKTNVGGAPSPARAIFHSLFKGLKGLFERLCQLFGCCSIFWSKKCLNLDPMDMTYIWFFQKQEIFCLTNEKRSLYTEELFRP
jgi:hypothetical protein